MSEKLTEKDIQIVVEAIINPPEPTDALIEAVKKYKSPCSAHDIESEKDEDK